MRKAGTVLKGQHCLKRGANNLVWVWFVRQGFLQDRLELKSLCNQIELLTLQSSRARTTGTCHHTIVLCIAGAGM